MEFGHIRARWVRLRGTKLGWTIYWCEGPDFDRDLHPSASIVELRGCFRFLYELFAPGDLILAGFTDKREVIQTSLNYWGWVVFGAFISNFAYIWDVIYIGTTATKAIRSAKLVCAVVFFAAYFFLNEPLGNHGLWLALTL